MESKNFVLKSWKAKDDVRVFGRYFKGDITYRQMKLRFMLNNDIDELSDYDFVNWMNGLGWRMRMPSDSRTDKLCDLYEDLDNVEILEEVEKL